MHLQKQNWNKVIATLHLILCKDDRKLNNSHDQRHLVLYHIFIRVKELLCLREWLRTKQFTHTGRTHTCITV